MAKLAIAPPELAIAPPELANRLALMVSTRQQLANWRGINQAFDC